MKNSTMQMKGYKPSQFAPAIQFFWGKDIHISDFRKGCGNCGRGEEKDHLVNCDNLWKQMRGTEGDKIECWRPPGSILVWGEEYERREQKDREVGELGNESITLEGV